MAIDEGPARVRAAARQQRTSQVVFACADYVFTSSIYAIREDLQLVGLSTRHGARFGWRGSRFDCALVGEQATIICGAFNVSVRLDCAYSDVGQAEVVIVPAYLAPPRGWNGPRGEPRFPVQMLDWLRDQYDGGAMLCGVLSGTYALAEAGLLDGQMATTHWIERPLLAQLYPQVLVDPNRALCVAGQDGRIVTIGANGAYHNDVVEYLVARLFGSDVLDTMDGMRGPLRGRPCIDAQAWLEARGNRTDADVRAAQDWLSTHFAVSNPVAAVCHRLHISSRTLSRRFNASIGMSPLAYVQALRVVAAQRLLERSERPIEDIAAEVGYDDVAFFRQQFKSRVGVNPAAYRRRMLARDA